MAQVSTARHPLGPYSRKLRRGAIGGSLDGRSELGRFVRDLEAQLIAHIGGSPTVVQKLLIERVIKATVQIDALDEKMASGNWTDTDARTHNGLVNRQRLLLRELGMKAAGDKPLSLAEQLAEDTRRRRAGEAVAA